MRDGRDERDETFVVPDSLAMTPLPLDTVIETERLRLRLPDERDLPHIFSATREPGFNDGMLWNPPATIDELHDPLARARAAWAQAQSYQFSIDTRAGEFVGRISLRPSNDDLVPEDLGGDPAAGWRVLDIGYWTHPAHQGRGLMTEALRAVVDLAFGTMEADALVAFHTMWNVGSQRVLEKAGFRRIRVFPGGFVKNGVPEDDALVRLDRAEWTRRS
ncbi:N-acetyltransferase [bacterium]|nr:MAG: N-acetyltransferase [bacterium]